VAGLGGIGQARAPQLTRAALPTGQARVHAGNGCQDVRQPQTVGTSAKHESGRVGVGGGRGGAVPSKSGGLGSCCVPDLRICKGLYYAPSPRITGSCHRTRVLPWPHYR